VKKPTKKITAKKQGKKPTPRIRKRTIEPVTPEYFYAVVKADGSIRKMGAVPLLAEVMFPNEMMEQTDRHAIVMVAGGLR